MPANTKARGVLLVFGDARYLEVLGSVDLASLSSFLKGKHESRRKINQSAPNSQNISRVLRHFCILTRQGNVSMGSTEIYNSALDFVLRGHAWPGLSFLIYLPSDDMAPHPPL